MSTVTLGTTPTGLTMWVIDAAPFTASVTSDAPFPSAPELLFDSGTSWPATLSSDGMTAAWLRTAQDVADLLATSPRRATLRDPDTHHVWAHGSVYITRVNPGDGPAGALPPGGAITVDHLDGAVHIAYTVTEPTIADHGNGTATIGGGSS